MSAFQIIPFVAYIAVASPATYKLTRGVLGNWIANSDGLATLSGVALHAVVYVLLVSLLMTLLTPRASGYGHMSSGYTHMMGQSDGCKAQALPDLMGAPFPAKI
jgi:hypothetical protein